VKRGAAALRAKLWAEWLAILAALALAALKGATGLAMNSIGLFSAAADSLIDVVLSGLNFYSIRLAASPADSEHPYGHGKVENLAGLGQAAIIIFLGGWVMVEAGRRLVGGVRPQHAEWGIAVMVVSTAVSWLVARHLRHVGTETDSVVLHADSLHYASDVWTNGGILVALLLWRLTGWALFDPVIGLAVGGLILWSAYRLLVRSIQDLMDAALPAAEQREIERIIRQHRFVVSFHDLRTRRAGSQRQVDFSVVACRHLPLGDAHDLVDHVEREIETAIPDTHVVVHAEPCEPECAVADRCVLRRTPANLLAHDEPSR
jgi:cation diffusion facilitator family transporter